MRDYGEDFDEKILECLENEGIYISLGYIQNEDVDNDLDFVNSSFSLNEDEELYFYEVRTDCSSKVFVTNEYLPCDITTDYGVKISRIGDGFDVEFALHGGGPTCWSTPSIDFFKDDGNLDGFVDINNPLNQLLVEMMFDCIVLK